jgi:serine/threonine protein phosphatase PrpC
MEDSHIAATGLDNNVSVFGVFDGHGGKNMQDLKAMIKAVRWRCT